MMKYLSIIVCIALLVGCSGGFSKNEIATDFHKTYSSKAYFIKSVGDRHIVIDEQGDLWFVQGCAWLFIKSSSTPIIESSTFRIGRAIDIGNFHATYNWDSHQVLEEQSD